MRQARLVDGAHRGRSPRNSAVEHRRSLESRWLSRARNELSWFSSEGIQGISGLGVGSQLASRNKTWLGRSSKEKERQQDCSKPLIDDWNFNAMVHTNEDFSGSLGHNVETPAGAFIKNKHEVVTAKQWCACVRVVEPMQWGQWWEIELILSYR